jgi:two-component system OmpR family response regulator
MKQRILIVDDDAALRRIYQKILKKYFSFSIGSAATAETGLQLFDDHGHDLILLDFNLPGMNGLEFLEIVKAKNDSVKVIMLTAGHSLELEKSAYTFGADHFMKKPFQISEFKKAVQKLMS